MTLANHVRCAIYTRKSSEEGLEQSFNSLHAQREACEAYVRSQKHEGWQVISTAYDDGGFSGGSMLRPALKKLLEDIAARKIDTVVVYKVDRLTRSLTDFAKIVEQFDKQGISFVSVTQQFNTTTSMGRLTLNVLLSFAQFEREVTGERIRDKIAASKRKGMWMGGVIPIGYDLQDRHLFVNPAEAETVREIFSSYLRLGCVSKLQTHLETSGIRSKSRTSKTGRMSGGKFYSRGSLYELLQNRIYLGEIIHREASYPGQHDAIVDRELWDKVQARFQENLQAPRRNQGTTSKSLLMGLLHDENGTLFTPSHASKKGKRYRYYVAGSSEGRGRMRLPAEEIEGLVLHELRTLLQSPQRLMDLLRISATAPIEARQMMEASQDWTAATTERVQTAVRAIVTGVIIQQQEVELQISRQALRELFAGPESKAPDFEGSREAPISIKVEARLKRFGGEIRFQLEPDSGRIIATGFRYSQPQISRSQKTGISCESFCVSVSGALCYRDEILILTSPSAWTPAQSQKRESLSGSP